MFDHGMLACCFAAPPKAGQEAGIGVFSRLGLAHQPCGCTPKRRCAGRAAARGTGPFKFAETSQRNKLIRAGRVSRAPDVGAYPPAAHSFRPPASAPNPVGHASKRRSGRKVRCGAAWMTPIELDANGKAPAVQRLDPRDSAIDRRPHDRIRGGGRRPWAESDGRRDRPAAVASARRRALASGLELRTVGNESHSQ